MPVAYIVLAYIVLATIVRVRPSSVVCRRCVHQTEMRRPARILRGHRDAIPAQCKDIAPSSPSHPQHPPSPGLVAPLWHPVPTGQGQGRYLRGVPMAALLVSRDRQGACVSSRPRGGGDSPAATVASSSTVLYGTRAAGSRFWAWMAASTQQRPARGVSIILITVQREFAANSRQKHQCSASNESFELVLL